MITQINCTNELHKMITQVNMMSHPRKETMNDAFGCSRATQVYMDNLKLVNLAYVQVKGVNTYRLLVNALDG